MKHNTFNFLIISLALTLLNVPLLYAESRYTVFRTPKSIKIDGVANDVGWQHIPQQRGFIYTNKMYTYSALQTSFKISYDSNNLYILIRANEPNLKECIEFAKNKRGQGIEILLDVPKGNNSNSKKHYQYAISISGKTLYEFKADLAGQAFDIKNTKWNKAHLGWKKAIYYGKNYYTIEIAVSFKSLGIKTPENCDEWGLQVGRFGTSWPRAEALKGLHWKIANWTAWVPMASGFWKQIKEHGIIEFTDIVKLPDEQNVGKIEKQINKKFDVWKKTRVKNMSEIQNKVAKTESAVDLCRKNKNLVSCLIDNRQTQGPPPKDAANNWTQYWHFWPWQREMAHTFVMTWEKPITFNCNVVRWKDVESYAVDYGLEYWNGKAWKLCYKKTGNNLSLSYKSFSPVTSDKLRFTMSSINSASYYFYVQNFSLFLLKDTQLKSTEEKKAVLKNTSAMFDGKLNTIWQTSGHQQKGDGFTIDLGEKTWLQRVVLRNAKDSLNFPRSLVLLTGSDPKKLKKFYEYNNTKNNFLIQSLRFNPVKGRFLRLEIGSKTSAYPWSVAELDTSLLSDNKDTVRNAVILPKGMPDFINRAARDVAYYLGEITNNPIAVISSGEANNYPGILFIIDKPKPVTFKQGDILHRKNEEVNVYKKDREIHFAGATSEAVMYSMFEFLDRQGVRWLYPSFDGDYISRKGKLDLSMLPIKYAPQFATRKFQINKEFLGYSESDSEALRWLEHNRYNMFWMPRGHAYRSTGSHSFNQLIPAKLYKNNPQLFPMYTNKKWKPKLKKKGFKLGQRVPYHSVGSMGTSFCTTSIEAREYIIKTLVEKLKKTPKLHSISIAEDDGNIWCECPRCQAQDKLKAADPWGNPGFSKTDRVVDLLRYIDKRIKELLPDRTIQIATFSYNQSRLPPVSNEELPNTFSTEICVYGGTLMVPPTSSRNTKLTQQFEDWGARIKHLGVYPYDLLSPRFKIPVTRVTSLGKWFKFWKQQNMDCITPEVSVNPVYWDMMPWLYYAFSRLSWNPDEPAKQILNDFFKGYYKEAWKPMLVYYKTLENHILQNDLGKYGWQTKADPEIFTLSILKKMNKYLNDSHLKATHHLTKARVQKTAKSFKYLLKLRDVNIEELLN